MIGCALTGEINVQKLFIAVGNGSNGKSTLFEVIKAVVGDYSITVQADSLMQKSTASGSAASPDIARLRGARLVTIAEGDRSHKLNEALVKQVTGNDRIVARPLYGDLFEFTLQCNFIMHTNYLPKIRGTDDGIWRRMAPIPFNASFTGNKIKKNLQEKLLKESAGILNWALEGCQLFLKEGLDEPQSVLDAKEAYRTASDNVRQFAEQELVITPSDPNAKIGKRDTLSSLPDLDSARRGGLPCIAA